MKRRERRHGAVQTADSGNSHQGVCAVDTKLD